MTNLTFSRKYWTFKKFSLALSCITAKHKWKCSPCIKIFGFTAPSHVVKCWNHPGDLAALITNSSTEVLAEKCSHGYSIKKLQALGVSSDFNFPCQQKVALGFIHSDIRQKEADIGINLMVEQILRVRQNGDFCCDLEIAAFSQNMTVYFSSPDRIWQKIGLTFTGPGKSICFMMILQSQCAATATAVFSYQKWELGDHGSLGTKTKVPNPHFSSAKAWGCISALIFPLYTKYLHLFCLLIDLVCYLITVCMQKVCCHVSSKLQTTVVHV